ncbi:hypothetical protein ANN_26063 [Periplaneta americana]|uniref:HTH psq-type domain-containing protein n=1 Tax=Periplaneta americana TaxID=6978 RepID=A0ABQ8S556_PERAM|nr:hypothetical protein ANN_26063 [Periplaneta americana]
MAPGARKKWSEEAMRKAVESVQKKEMGFLKASKLYQVPRSTLENYVNHKSKTIDELLKGKIGRKCVLGEELERELALYCKIMDERYYGLRRKDPELEKLAFNPTKVYNVDETGIIAVQGSRSKVISIKGKKSRRKTTVITSSPYKSHLQESITKAAEKQVKDKKSSSSSNGKSNPRKRHPMSALSSKERKKKPKSHEPDSSDTDDSSSEPIFVSTDDEDSEDEDCLYCSEPYKNDNHGEKWIRCTKCLQWAHELCAGAQKGTWKTFVCDSCCN